VNFLSQQSQQEAVKRYLLGVLPEEEKERFEQRYFSDNTLFEEVELAEDDLVDRYVRGELTKDDRRLFEQALSHSPRLNERVEFAKVLSTKTTSQPAPKVEPVSAPGFWQRIFSPEKQSFRLAFGFAALLLIMGGVAVVIGWVNLRQQSAGLAARDAELRQRNEATARELAEKQAANEQRAGDLQKQAADLEAQRQSIKEQIENADRPLNLIARLSLQPGATRSPADRANLTLNKNYSTLNLKLALIDSDYPRYRAVVLTPEQKVVSRARILTPKRTAAGNFLNLSLPLKGIKPGDYFVSVEGIDDAGKSQPVDIYPFQLNAPSNR
jgi:Sec-independent protein translocase protein TatA